MFWRISKMLMNQVDAGGAGAAPAAGQQQTTTTTTTETAAGATPKTFTQEEVNNIVAERVARVKQQATGTSQTQQTTTTAQPAATKANPDAPVTRQEFEGMQRRSAFDKHAARLGLEPAVEEDLWTLYDAQRPTDAVAWFESKQKMLGLKGSQSVNQDPNSQTTNTNGASGNGGTQPGAAPNAGGKVNPTTSGGLVDIFNLSMDQVIQLGPQGLRQHHEKNLEAARMRDGAPPIPKMPAR